MPSHSLFVPVYLKLPKDLDEGLRSVCGHYGDYTYHVRQAIRAYLNNPVNLKKSVRRRKENEE